MSKKTVFVLGAGFSVDAGAPKQSDLIKEILALPKAYPRKYKTTVSNWVHEFKDFMIDTLNIHEEHLIHYNLEDLYTPMDRAIVDNASFRRYSTEQLIKKRNIFNKLVILAMRNAIAKNTKKNSTNEVFAKHICDQAKLRLKNSNNDAVSVITTNWDIMLDNQINSIIQEYNTSNDMKNRGVLDYCCYISSLTENDHNIESGLFVLGQGGFNVKVIKLHGSLNWLQCPRCNRLYVKLYRKWNGGYVFDKKYCYHCKRNYSENDNDSILLNSSMVMPTFLKDLNNLQIKLSWMNAANELSEANKVVFLGYSLSEADFEFKQLLSRMIKKEAVIDSVLIQDDNPDNYEPKSKLKTAGYRYESFFSGRELNMYYDGVNKYVESL
jgi:NAD-dependent SIR2 family protein deacetylase